MPVTLAVDRAKRSKRLQKHQPSLFLVCSGAHPAAALEQGAVLVPED